jgi:nucleoside 2-deoxyribosyltransferase
LIVDPKETTMGNNVGFGKPVECYIWGTAAEIVDEENDDPDYMISSPRAGGHYIVSKSLAPEDIRFGLDESNKASLTLWIRGKQNDQDAPRIDEALIAEFLSRPVKRVTDRIDYAVLWFEDHQADLASSVQLLSMDHGVNQEDRRLFRFYDFLAATSCISTGDGYALLGFLKNDGLLEENKSQFRLTSKGWKRVADLAKVETGVSCFVAMWFSDEMFKIYDDAIAPAIRDAKYEPMLINRKQHNNKVDDEIVSEIRRAKFIVADFTTKFHELRDNTGKMISKIAPARGGVYFEAGFALGLGKPVIWCARKDIVDAGELHFDTRQFAHIVWTDAEDLRKQLKDRITATQGEGPIR